MDPILLAIAAPIAVLTVVVVVMVFTTADSRVSGKESLRAIESYTWQDDQLVAKELPFFDRCLLYTSPSPRDGLLSRMPSSA